MYIYAHARTRVSTYIPYSFLLFYIFINTLHIYVADARGTRAEKVVQQRKERILKHLINVLSK